MTDDRKQDSHRSVELEVEVDGTPEAIWKAMSEGEEVRRWFAPEARVTPGVGGSIWLSWGGGVEGEGTIDIWEPERRLRWIENWGSSGDDTSEESDSPDSETAKDPEAGDGTESPGIVQTAVDFHIETRDGKTFVRLVHTGFSASADWDEYYDATVAGWTYFLWNLAFYVERHFGVPRHMVSERRSTTRPFAEVWSDLFGPKGLAIAESDRLTRGDRLVLTLGSRTLEGDVRYVRHPRNLAATLEGLDDGLLFVEMEPSGGEAWCCGIWISTYGLPAEETSALQGQLTAMADTLFGEPTAA